MRGRRIHIDSFVFSDFQDLIAQSILADRREQGNGNAQLGDMSGDVKRSATRVPTRRQAVPKYFAKGKEFSVHGEGCSGMYGKIASGLRPIVGGRRHESLAWIGNNSSSKARMVFIEKETLFLR